MKNKGWKWWKCGLGERQGWAGQKKKRNDAILQEIDEKRNNYNYYEKECFLSTWFTC